MQVLKVIKQHGKTLGEVASALGVTKGTFSVTINNKPKLQRLFDIANYLNCSPAEFFADWDTAPENIHRIAEQQQPEEAESEKLQQDEDAAKAQTEQSAPSPADDLPFKDDKEKEHQEEMSELEKLVFGQQKQKSLVPAAAFLCPHCNKAVTIGIMKN